MCVCDICSQVFPHSTCPTTGVFSSSNALVRQAYLVIPRITFTNKCSLWTGFVKRKELVSQSIQNCPPPICQRKVTLWRKTFCSSSARSCWHSAPSPSSFLLFLEPDTHRTRHPPRTGRPINSGHLPPLLSIE